VWKRDVMAEEMVGKCQISYFASQSHYPMIGEISYDWETPRLCLCTIHLLVMLSLEPTMKLYRHHTAQ
jgi:hypothetical protein